MTAGDGDRFRVTQVTFFTMSAVVDILLRCDAAAYFRLMLLGGGELLP